MARTSRYRGTFARWLGVSIPLPIVSLVLIGAGVGIGDTLLVAAHQRGSTSQYWLATALMLGGPLAGIAVFVFHLRTVRQH